MAWYQICSVCASPLTTFWQFHHHNHLLTHKFFILTLQELINFMLWWWVNTQTECVPDEPGRTHHLGHKLQNFENPTCLGGYFHLKIECSSLRFARRSLFLFMYIPANANIVHFAWPFLWKSSQLSLLSFHEWLISLSLAMARIKHFLWQNLLTFELNIVKLGNTHYIDINQPLKRTESEILNFLTRRLTT